MKYDGFHELHDFQVIYKEISITWLGLMKLIWILLFMIQLDLNSIDFTWISFNFMILDSIVHEPIFCPNS